MEKLKDVPGLEDYFQVNKLGQVWSKRTKKFLKQVKSKTGYWTIPTKFGGRKGRYRCFKVHRLIAETFIPNPENKLYVNHKDSNKLNNHVDNLEWCTHSENMQHAYIFGNLKLAAAKLTDDQVRQIRKDFSVHTFKNKQQFIIHYMDFYKVSQNCIRSIIDNKTFTDLL